MTEISYEQFNSIVDYRNYFLQHPKHEELRLDCLHFLGDRFQLIDGIIREGLKVGDCIQCNPGVIFFKEEIKVEAGSILILVKKIDQYLWEGVLYSPDNFLSSIKKKKAKTFLVPEATVIGLAQSLGFNSTLSDPIYLETISAFGSRIK